MAVYCSNCGASLGDDARFCSTCGKAMAKSGSAPGYGAGSAPGYRASRRPPLTRARAGRKVAGVCQGLANTYGWDITLVRVIAILVAVVLFPIGLIAYAIFWLAVPDEPLALAPVNSAPSNV